MNFGTRSVFTIMAALSAGLASQACQADEKPSPWSFEAGLYFYVPAVVDGTATASGVEADWDLDYGDVYDLLEFAGAGRIEGWRDLGNATEDAFGIILDGQYIDLGYDTRVRGSKLDIDIRRSMIDLLAGYKFPPIKFGADSQKSLTFDTNAGIRYNYLHQKYNVPAGLAPPLDSDLGGSETWFEPVVGARGKLKLGDTWSLILRGDVAGFDIDDSMAWSVTGISSWQVGESVSLKLGYRIYDLDYSTGSGSNEFGFDGTQHGPAVGISFGF